MWFFLFACQSPKESVPPIELEHLTPVGEAPWDGFQFVTSDGLDHTPLVHDANGAKVDVALREIAWRGVWGAATGNFAEGTYTLDGIDGEDLGWAAPFQIVDPRSGVNTSLLPNTTWDLNLGTMGPIGSVLTSVATATHLLLGEPNGTQIPFQLVIESTEVGNCLLLSGDGTLDADGNFTWNDQGLSWLSEPAVTADTMGLRVGFGNGTAGGAEIDLRSDLRDLSAYLYENNDPDGLCIAASNLGETCEPCPDGEQSCAWLGLYGGTLTPSTWTPSDGQLPVCQTVLQEDYIPDIQASCSCTNGSPVGMFGLLGVLGLFWRRRTTEERR